MPGRKLTFFVCLSPKRMQFEMLCQEVWKAWGKSWNCDLLNIKLYQGKLSIPQSGKGLGKMALGRVASSLPSFCSLCPVSELLGLHDSTGWGYLLPFHWYFLSGNCWLVCKHYDLGFISCCEEREWQNQLIYLFQVQSKNRWWNLPQDCRLRKISKNWFYFCSSQRLLVPKQWSVSPLHLFSLS